MAIHCYGESSKDSVEESLVLSIALQLYSYTDFGNVKNLKQHAGLCLERANYFVDAYKEYKSKNKLKEL